MTMTRVAWIRTRSHVALWLFLSLHIASRCNSAADWHKQPVVLQASLATWTEAAERCAALGPGLAPHELAAQAAADRLLGPVATGRPQCTPHGSDVTVLWVEVGDGPTDEQCHGLVFNHTSRQAHLAGEACAQRHCFLCSAPQAGLRKSTSGSTQSGRHLMNLANCNMAGPQINGHCCLQ
jgi:hypothetical protein